jgi:hypothetical protein
MGGKIGARMKIRAFFYTSELEQLRHDDPS